MDERLKDIENLVNAIDKSENDKKMIEITKMINEKFQELKYYKMMDPCKIRKGDIIRYLDLNLNTLSKPAIVINTKTITSYNMKCELVKSFILSSSRARANRFIWMIK